MIWRAEVDAVGVRGQKFEPPNGLEVSHYIPGRDAVVCLPPMIAQVVGFWHRHHLSFAHKRLAARIGFLYDPPGNCGYYDTMRWRWDFWNGNRSWLSLRYQARHGYDAYRIRFKP